MTTLFSAGKLLMLSATLWASHADQPMGCTLCSNGDAFNPIAVTDFGVPCAVLAVTARTLEPPPDTECLAIQFTGFQQCGCPNLPDIIPGDTCHVCGDSSLSFNEEKQVFDTELVSPIFFGDETTCGELNTVASFTPDTVGACGVFESLGGYCECEGQTPSCTVCPDGTPVPDPSLSLADLDGLTDLIDFDFADPDQITCGALDFAAAFVGGDTGSDQCNQLQDFAFACGCPGAEPKCTLCPLGESPPNANVVVPTIGGAELSCAELNTAVTAFAEEAQCSTAQRTGVLLCGCQPPEETGGCGTSICPDGSAIPDPDALVFFGGAFLTCSELETVLNVLDDPVDCEQVAFIGVQLCGCTGGDPPNCPLCEDGSDIPEPLLEIGPGEVCVDLAFDAFSLVPGDASCTAVQSTVGVYCGCSNPIAAPSACRLCGDDNLLPDPSREVSAPGALSFLSGSCGRIELLATAGDVACGQAQASFGMECCVADDPPTASPTAPQPTTSTTDPPVSDMPSSAPTVSQTQPPQTQPPFPTSGSVAKTPTAIFAIVMSSFALMSYF